MSQCAINSFYDAFFLTVFSQSYEITEDDKFKADILYEHSVMMVEYSSKEQLEKIGLDGSKLIRNDFLSAEEKVKIMEESYGLNLKDLRFDKKLETLDKEMLKMMENWEFE